MSTHTVRKVKITSAQIIALREASMSDDGMYALTTAKGQTINALVRAGIVVEGCRLLTVQGVSVMHTVRNVEIIASKGHTVYVSDSPESLETFTLAPVSEGVEESATNATGDAENGAQSLECTCAPNGDNSWCAKHYPAPVIADGMDIRFPRVTIQGAEGFDMVPNMSALTGECFFGCGRPVTGMFTDYVGKTEGVCDFDRAGLGDHITVIPVDPSVWGGASETGVATVCVIQNTPGMNGRSHYHAPGCRDVAREMKHWGQKSGDVMEATFSDVVEILEFEYGDISANEFEIGSADYWADILHNATIDADMVNGFGVKVMPCLDIPAGRTPNGPLVTQGGFYRIGFDQPTPERVAEIRAEIDAHTCDETDCITCIVRDMNREQIPSVEEFPNERAYKSGTENATDYVRDAGLVMYGEEWQNTFRSSYALSMEIQATENDETEDAGFVETLVTKEYELSVIVDDVTGTRVSLGWVTLTMNAAQCMDFDRVAEEYGRTQNTRTPRHGWASIITVHDVCDV